MRSNSFANSFSHRKSNYVDTNNPAICVAYHFNSFIFANFFAYICNTFRKSVINPDLFSVARTYPKSTNNVSFTKSYSFGPNSISNIEPFHNSDILSTNDDANFCNTYKSAYFASIINKSNYKHSHQYSFSSTYVNTDGFALMLS
jgi:hypothetical protein